MDPRAEEVNKTTGAARAGSSGESNSPNECRLRNSRSESLTSNQPSLHHLGQLKSTRILEAQKTEDENANTEKHATTKAHDSLETALGGGGMDDE